MDMNDKRAGWAETALRAFSAETGSAIPDEAVGDLLCDLGHYCDRNGLDFIEIVSGSIAVWKAEIADPDGLAPEPEVRIEIYDCGDGQHSPNEDGTMCTECGKEL